MQVFNNPAPVESEDCLYLNVYTPAAPAAGKGRAVMFWIYGGSLQFGNAGQQYYDGSQFAAYEDVIVVSTNYRTNVFGFPSSPELSSTGHNLGFLDQRFALDWVQRNIHAFGGDPAKVTIFGEPIGRGAILESGQYSYRFSPPVNNVPAWNSLAATLNCSSATSNLTCIRAASATDIKSIIEHQNLIFNPIPDNITLMSKPAEMRTSGNIANIPVMSGTNSQEGRVFVVGQNDTAAYLNATFGAFPPALVSAIAAAYPLGQNGLNTPYDQISQIFTEYIFQCNQALFANASAAAGIPSWLYYFNASFPNTQGFPGAGVYHSSEIPLVFTSYTPVGTTVQEYALSNFMRGAWARFAKDPANGPGWNRVGSGAQYGAPADMDLGVLGDRLNAKGSGVTVIRESEVNGRCGLFKPVYDTILALTGEGPTPS
ncbi:hypothetical protein B0A49_01429 [Cryomyces minteri]|uniref:Carboxylesterase type B domain-containing protein n=1 Tax=Cryomyces minteri TaxID=331657 RepID=A0A4U0XRM7_9PEZI|nr:hypothetical protein B0A49_01429 [Cryomyces minteri]